MTSPRNRRLLPYLVGIILFLQPSGPAIAQAHEVKSLLNDKLASVWTKDDHTLFLMWENNLKDIADRLDDCTFKGRFANKYRDDVCLDVLDRANNMLNVHEEYGIPQIIQHSCAKWRDLVRTAQNKQDCQELGRLWWHLQDAVNRALFYGGDMTEYVAKVNRDIEYVAKVNPGEVSRELKFLQQLNAELEKPNPNPGFAFKAGSEEADLTLWLFTHCPTELAWGLPSKQYATALTACSALEPELRRFERNVGRLLDSVPTDDTTSK